MDAVEDGEQTDTGRLIGGRYRLVAKLGSGGYGRVWRARDERLKIDVAIKEVWLPPALSAQEQADRLIRAEREARNAALLRDHPHVVAVHDVVIEDDVPWTVMQLIAGRSVQDHLTEFGPLSVPDTTRVASALLKALDAAHTAGIVHRDVKPANVMLSTTGNVLLTDFGIAVRHTDSSLTATGVFLGSVEYIAPERAEGEDGLAVSDLFSLGVTLYQSVEGISPFRKGTPTGSLKAVLFDEPPPLRRAGELTPVIMGLLQKDPGNRLTAGQALELIEGLEPIEAGPRPRSISAGAPAPAPSSVAMPTPTPPPPPTRSITGIAPAGLETQGSVPRWLRAAWLPVLMAVIGAATLVMPGVSGHETVVFKPGQPLSHSAITTTAVTFQTLASAATGAGWLPFAASPAGLVVALGAVGLMRGHRRTPVLRVLAYLGSLVALAATAIHIPALGSAHTRQAVLRFGVADGHDVRTGLRIQHSADYTSTADGVVAYLLLTVAVTALVVVRDLRSADQQDLAGVPR